MRFLPSFRLRPCHQTKTEIASPAAPLSKRRRRLAFAFGIIALLVFPIVFFQIVLYRANLAVADAARPLAAPLQKRDRLLIISPHCDDETLGAGGTIAAAREAGAKVKIVFLTNGDGSRSTQLVARSREFKSGLQPRAWFGKAKKNSQVAPKNLFERIAVMRQKEALAACAEMGVEKNDVIFLGYPDGGTQAMWEKNWSASNAFVSPYTKTSRSPYANSFTPNAIYCGEQLARDLEKIIENFQPTTVLTTHPEDTHPDHWAAYAYTSLALERSGLRAAGSTPGGAKQGGKPARLLTFLVHHGIWPTPHGYHPQRHLTPPASLEKSGTRWISEPLSSQSRAQKKSALEKYTSQLVWTPHYLRSFLRRNELFGELSGSGFKVQSSGLKTLLKDAPSDSSWRERWAAGDIQSLKVQSKPGVLQVQTNLSRASSPRVKYDFILHVVSKNGISAWQIKARRNGSRLQATLISLDESAAGKKLKGDNRNSDEIRLQGQLAPRGFVFDLPEKVLKHSASGVLQTRKTILVSSATFIGRTRLDQTATAILRLP